MPLTLIHVTAAYSNAVLIAIMPHVTDFSKKLDLPTPLPITSEQVSKFKVSPFQEMVGGGLWLTNQYWFLFERGAVTGFRGVPNFFQDETFPLDITKYTGKDNMTTNEAVQMARDALSKLGYAPKALNADTSPTQVQGPFDTKDGHHVPYCEIKWDRETGKPEDIVNAVHIQFQINLDSKQIVGLSIVSQKIWRDNVKIGVPIETEFEYRKHAQIKIQVNTNAPKSLGIKPVTLDTNNTIMIVPK